MSPQSQRSPTSMQRSYFNYQSAARPRSYHGLPDRRSGTPPRNAAAHAGVLDGSTSKTSGANNGNDGSELMSLRARIKELESKHDSDQSGRDPTNSSKTAGGNLTPAKTPNPKFSPKISHKKASKAEKNSPVKRRSKVRNTTNRQRASSNPRPIKSAATKSLQRKTSSPKKSVKKSTRGETSQKSPRNSRTRNRSSTQNSGHTQRTKKGSKKGFSPGSLKLKKGTNVDMGDEVVMLKEKKSTLRKSSAKKKKRRDEPKLKGDQKHDDTIGDVGIATPKEYEGNVRRRDDKKHDSGEGPEPTLKPRDPIHLTPTSSDLRHRTKAPTNPPTKRSKIQATAEKDTQFKTPLGYRNIQEQEKQKTKHTGLDPVDQVLPNVKMGNLGGGLSGRRAKNLSVASDWSLGMSHKRGFSDATTGSTGNDSVFTNIQRTQQYFNAEKAPKTPTLGAQEIPTKEEVDEIHLERAIRELERKTTSNKNAQNPQGGRKPLRVDIHAPSASTISTSIDVQGTNGNAEGKYEIIATDKQLLESANLSVATKPSRVPLTPGTPAIGGSHKTAPDVLFANSQQPKNSGKTLSQQTPKETPKAEESEKSTLLDPERSVKGIPGGVQNQVKEDRRTLSQTEVAAITAYKNSFQQFSKSPSTNPNEVKDTEHEDKEENDFDDFEAADHLATFLDEEEGTKPIQAITDVSGLRGNEQSVVVSEIHADMSSLGSNSGPPLKIYSPNESKLGRLGTNVLATVSTHNDVASSSSRLDRSSHQLKVIDLKPKQQPATGSLRYPGNAATTEMGPAPPITSTAKRKNDGSSEGCCAVS